MLKPAILFKDNMVLQRDKVIPIWGTAKPGAAVTVSIQDKIVRGQADTEGQWCAKIGPLNASLSETLTIFSSSEKILLHNVAVGEVWLAGGQSNMEFHMRYDADMDTEKPVCETPNIRFFDYPEVSYVGQIDEADYGKEYGFWRPCTPEQLERFSAVGYYFAKDICRELKVPVGIIGCNWGGTPACAWMTKEAIVAGGGQVYLDEYEEALRNLDLAQYDAAFRGTPGNFKTDQLADPISDMMLFGCTMEEFDAKLKAIGVDPASMANYGPVMGPKYERRPGGLYESMLLPIAPYGIRGVIWYQGETDGDTYPELYATLFPAMIRCWRDLWQEELPFFFAQIAPLDQWMVCFGEPYAIIRAAQQHTADTVPNTGMAVTSDVGMKHDIHPKKKQPVGHRLALQALAKAYGRNILCEAPTLTGFETEDGKLTLTFENAGDGLYLAEQTPYGQVVGANRLGGIHVFQNGESFTEKDFTAKVQENTVTLFNDRICADAQTRISLAETGWYLVNLYNSADIPARPACL